MTTSGAPTPKAGFGAQIHGSRKGLGGDLPNAPVKRATSRRPDEATEAQITDMQSEGPALPAPPAHQPHQPH
jgi:hypothetical protein